MGSGERGTWSESVQSCLDAPALSLLPLRHGDDGEISACNGGLHQFSPGADGNGDAINVRAAQRLIGHVGYERDAAPREHLFERAETFCLPRGQYDRPDPAPNLAHWIIPLRRADQNAVNARLLQQQSRDLPRRGQGHRVLGLVQEGDHAGARRQVLRPALRMRQHGRDHGGCDRIAQRSAGQLSHELWTVDVLGVQGLTQHVQTHQGDNHRCTGWDYRLMRCGGLERQSARAVRLDDQRVDRGVGGDAVEQLGRHALHFVLLHDDLTGDDHVTMGFKRAGQFGHQRRFVFRDEPRGCAVHLADKDARGHRRDDAAAGRGQLVGQPEHQRGFAAAADEDDDLFGANPQGVRKLHRNHHT